MWEHPDGDVGGTFREEKAPKGESQERCRYEKRPARDVGSRRQEGSQTLQAARASGATLAFADRQP